MTTDTGHRLGPSGVECRYCGVDRYSKEAKKPCSVVKQTRSGVLIHKGNVPLGKKKKLSLQGQ